MLLPLPDNTCNLCGRRDPSPRTLRQRSECRGRCVRGGLGPQDYALESAILLRLRGLAPGSERTLGQVLPEQGPAGTPAWERARHAAQRLVARRQLEILHDGRVVDELPDAEDGFRLRLPRG